jgi:hypothetical protein
MKILLTIAAAAVLAGCATAPASRNYSTQYAPPPADPSQWHVVSVTPVPPGTRERYGNVDNGSSDQYRSGQVASTYAPQAGYAPNNYYAPNTYYAPQPVYVAPPMYAPAPAYYYPPVSIGLDFMFGRSWGGHGHRGGRNWGGVGIGSRWHR